MKDLHEDSITHPNDPPRRRIVRLTVDEHGLAYLKAGLESYTADIENEISNGLSHVRDLEEEQEAQREIDIVNAEIQEMEHQVSYTKQLIIRLERAEKKLTE